jgi:hypothetical protein
MIIAVIQFIIVHLWSSQAHWLDTIRASWLAGYFDFGCWVHDSVDLNGSLFIVHFIAGLSKLSVLIHRKIEIEGVPKTLVPNNLNPTCSTSFFDVFTSQVSVFFRIIST